MGMSTRHALVAGATLVFLAPSMWALMQAEDPELPVGKGRDTMVSVCSSCHALSKVTARRQSRKEWEGTVSNMVERGARIQPDEATGIVDYLAQHFGEASAAESKRVPAAEASGGERRTSGLPAGPARDLVAAKCSQCHGENMWRDQRQDRTKWEGTVYRMVGKGALWSEEEIAAMTDYLAGAFGPKTKPSPGGSK